MKKGIILSCLDPRLHHLPGLILPQMSVEAAYNPRYAGPDGILHEDAFPEQAASMKAEIQRLQSLGPIAEFAVCGHTTCAGHPVDDDSHRTHTRVAAQRLRVMVELPDDVPVRAFLAVRGDSDQDWAVEDLGTF